MATQSLAALQQGRWPVLDTNADFESHRLQALCTQNGIKLERLNAADLWHYMRIVRNVRNGWQPRGHDAWVFALAPQIRDAWLYSNGGDREETRQPYVPGTFGQWWPVVIAVPAEPQTSSIIPFVCPALTDTSRKCWGAHMSRLYLRRDAAPPPPPPPPPYPPPTIYIDTPGPVVEELDDDASSMAAASEGSYVFAEMEAEQAPSQRPRRWGRSRQ